MQEQDFWQIAIIAFSLAVVWMLNDIRQTLRNTHKLIAHDIKRTWPADFD
jgi:hypothetical protein